MMMKDYMKNLTSIEEFDKALAADKISVFTFSANWCPDCRFIEPFMPELVKRYADYDFYYVDRDEWIELCQRLLVMGIPSFVAVGKGKEIARFVSKLRKSESEISAFFDSLNA